MSAPTDPAAPNPYAPPREADGPAIELPNNEAIQALFATGENGAGWFYWIAGLSLINTISVLGGMNFGFALGLGVTLIADSMAVAAVQQGAPEHWKIAALVFDLVVLGLTVGCGWLSRKRFLPVFALGMFLYLLDGLLFLFIFDIISIAIHAFALWQMWSGFTAFRQLNQLQRQMAMMPGGAQ